MGVFGEGMSSSWSRHPQHIPVNQWTHQLLICDWHSVNNSHTEMQTCQCCHRPPLECIPCAVIPYDLSHCILGCCQPVELTAPLPGHHLTPRQRLISWLFSKCNYQIVRDCVWNSDKSITFCSVVSSPHRHKSVCFLYRTQSYKTQPWDQPLSWQQMCVMVTRYTPEGKPYKAMTATHWFCVQCYVTTQSPRSTALNNLQQHTQKRLRQQALNVRNAQFLGPSQVLLTNHISCSGDSFTPATYISLFPTHVNQSEPTTGTGSAMRDG